MTSAVDLALRAFDANDISVSDASAHLFAPLDRQRILALRLACTGAAATEAKELVAPLRSAILLEHAVARTLDDAGAQQEALAVRLEALALCPRWESWLSALLLTKTAENLLAVGRPAEAIPVVRRALGFLPADPRAIAVLARATSGAEAAALRAWLFDVGFSELLVPGSPTESDRAATAWAPSLAVLEPMDDEQMARHLVYTHIDIGLANHLSQGRRHAAAQLRYGDMAGALGTLGAYAGGTPNREAPARWLAFPYGYTTEYLAVDVLHALVEPRGAPPEPCAPAMSHVRPGEAKRTRLKLHKQLNHRLPGVRAAALSGADAQRARPLLFDRVAAVRAAAARALPDEPLVRRAHELEQTVLPRPAVFAGDPEGALTPGYDGHGLPTPAFGGKTYEFPAPQGADAVKLDADAAADGWLPHLAPSPNARSKCKVCKAAILAGEMRLIVREKAFPVETRFFHPRCATSKKHQPLLDRATARSRH